MADVTRAVTLWRGGRRMDAELEIVELLRTTPDDVTALKYLAEIYAASDRASQAAAIWRRLTALNQADAGVLRQLAQVLLAERAFGEAIEVLRGAIALEPANPRTYNNLGLAQLRSGDAAGAAESLERAVSIDPGYSLGHLNLGLAYRTLNRNEDARSSFEQALRLDPHLSPARLQLSELLRESDARAARRERDRALESQAINLMSIRRHDAAVSVWAQLIGEQAAIDYMPGTLFHCRLHCCDWSRYEPTAIQLQADVLDGERVDLPFSFFVHSNSPEAQLRCSRTFVADRYPAMAGPPPDTRRLRSQRIRVAYLSFDFHEHATAYLLAGLFECHDRSQFEIVALSYGQHDGSAMRTRLEASVDRFVDISRDTDHEAADRMRNLGIHIAVDLKGFTGGARTGILAWRAAPLQINFLGYPGTMGAPFIDYIVADHHLIPESDRIHYSEQPIYLPHSYQPNDAKRPLPTESPSRSDLGLPERGFVFCCFNNLYKITPAVFDIWMDTLRGVEGSLLWLLEGAPMAMHNLRNAAADRGIASERILFAPHIELAQHLARYRHADLFLDTAPCNAHTTASDALWMGVPVLTLTGQTFAGRVATSLLHAVGLPQLCTASPEAYAAQAMRLANSADELAALKEHLERGRRTFPLFDTAAYARDLEQAYQVIWARHERGEPPATLEVRA